MVSSLTRHLYRHRRVTPSSCANSLTSSQVLRRSTAIRWNFREYRFRFTLQPFPCKVCPSRLSHFKGAVQFRRHLHSEEQFAQRVGGKAVGSPASPTGCDHKLRTEPSGSPHIFSPACPEPLGATNRCIIPPREHPPERNRMPRPGLPRRKRNHHSRILPALLERSRQCLQPEIEPRTRHESGRVCRPPGAPFFGRAIPRPLRQRRDRKS